MKRFNTITGSELLSKEIQQIPFVVNDLLPIGLTLLAGEAKAGKSWLALWLSVQVANGDAVWGYDVRGGTSLYLCYEDNEIRIQNRLLDITDEAPSNVHFCTEVSRLGGELEERIKTFITEHRDTKLIIIDTLQTVRPINSDSSYSNDYSDLMVLKKLADEYKIAILLIHHFRKQKDSDVFHQITGSTGLQGAVDTMFALTQGNRGDKTAKLKCTGRDIESRELELVRDENNIWIKVADSLSESTLSDIRFIDAVKKFMSDKDSYSGTATDLSALLAGHSDDNFSVKSIAKNIKRLTKGLESLGIMGVCRRSNGIRLIEIIKISADSDGMKSVS